MGSRALVVDACAARFDVYRDLLREEGIEADWVSDGARADEYLRSHARVALLITELSLPVLDGFEVLRRLKLTPSSGAPVLVASAFRELRQAASELRTKLGITMVLTTSSTKVSLQRVIRKLLDRGLPDETMIDEAPSEEQEARRHASLERARVTSAHAVTDEQLDAIVRSTAIEFGVPTALVSIVLRRKQWFKARVGMVADETPIDRSFCRHVVEAKEPMFVPDARMHPTFASNPLVRDKTVRGYAGAPLIGSDGEVWGSLCIIDPESPITHDATSLARLSELARRVVGEIERAAGERAAPSEIEARYGTFSERVAAIAARANKT